MSMIDMPRSTLQRITYQWLKTKHGYRAPATRHSNSKAEWIFAIIVCAVSLSATILQFVLQSLK